MGLEALLSALPEQGWLQQTPVFVDASCIIHAAEQPELRQAASAHGELWARIHQARSALSAKGATVQFFKVKSHVAVEQQVRLHTPPWQLCGSVIVDSLAEHAADA